MRFWDQKNGLAAHQRLSALPTVRVDNSGEARRVFVPNESNRVRGAKKPHLCRDCGEQDNEKFYARRKSLCIACTLAQYRRQKNGG